MRDAQGAQIIQSGWITGLRMGALLHHTEVFAAFRRIHTGRRVDGQIANAGFRDDRVGRFAERGHACACIARFAGRQDDGPLPVRHRSGGVGVGGGRRRPVGEGELVVVGLRLGVIGAACEVGKDVGPHAFLPDGHGIGACHFGRGIGVVERSQRDLDRSGCPELERGLLVRVGRAEIVLVIGIPLVEGIRTDHGAQSDRLAAIARHRKRVGRGDFEVLAGGDGQGAAILFHRRHIDGAAMVVAHCHCVCGGLRIIHRLVECGLDRVEGVHLCGDDAGLRPVEGAIGVYGRISLHQPDLRCG